MKSCPVCRSSDNNPHACDACGYNPVASFIEEEEDSEFLASVLEATEYDFYEQELVDGIEFEHPDATWCPICRNRAYVFGECLYCGYSEYREDPFEQVMLEASLLY